MPGEIRDTPPCRVLIVEDHPLIGELLAEMLEALGHTVCALVVTQGAAVSAAAELRPSLIIIDAHLGSGCGLAAMTDILHAGFVAHIYMSGDIRSLTALRPNAVSLGKPFQSGDLERAIHRAMHAAPLVPAPELA